MAARRTIDFLFLVLLVLDRGEVHDCLIGENESPRFEVSIAGLEHGVEHRLV